MRLLQPLKGLNLWYKYRQLHRLWPSASFSPSSRCRLVFAAAMSKLAPVHDRDFEFIETPKFTQPDFDKLENYNISTTRVSSGGNC